jgi:hypothetical protein
MFPRLFSTRKRIMSIMSILKIYNWLLIHVWKNQSPWNQHNESNQNFNRSKKLQFRKLYKYIWSKAIKNERIKRYKKQWTSS